MWENFERYGRRTTALSDRIYDIYSAWSESFVGLVPNFEILYNTWEIIAAIAYCESYDLDQLMDATSVGHIRPAGWLPIGRSGWNSEVRQIILNQIKSDNFRQILLDAGFGKGDRVFLDRAISCFERAAWYL